MLQKRIIENEESKDIGTLNIFPNELLETIFCMALNKDTLSRSTITVTKKEFFIDLLPYIFIRVDKQHFITNFSDFNNDIIPPQDIRALVIEYYKKN